MKSWLGQWRRLGMWLAAMALVATGGVTGAVDVVGAEIDFAHQVAPLLKARCIKCHAGAEKQGGLSMNTRAELLRGGDSGAAVVVGKSQESELVRRITSHDQEERMPPEGAALSAEEIAVVTKWIESGAAWDAGFAFQKAAYEPPLLPRTVELPPPRAGRTHPVDRIVDAYLARQKVEPPPAVADHVFLRRASLDLVGLLPPADAARTFAADGDPHKRAKLVDALLTDDIAYAEHWLSFWNDLLRNDYTGTGFITGGRKQITTWLYKSLVDNKPYDQFARELLAPGRDAEGFIQGIRWRGTVSASQLPEVQFAQNVSQVFLGINMKCASCHNSFIDRWTLDETYALAAIYANTPLDIHRCDKPTGATAKAAWIFPELGQIDTQAAPRERLSQLARLMTHADNGRFTRTIVNRLWHRLLGRGIVHPVDAMHTPPWSADLLDYLANDLAAHGYDLKHTLRRICTSEAYQSAMARGGPAADETQYIFRGPVPRRLSAEQFVDAMWQLTDTAPTKYDAAVERYRLGSRNAAEPRGLTGRWIWNAAQASADTPPAGETIACRRVFDLPSGTRRAVAAITCDNDYVLYVNGKKVGADGDWESVEVYPLDALFKAGENRIVIVAKNGGGGPNPAGLFFEVRYETESGVKHTIGTDAAWEWSTTLPDGKGAYKDTPTVWRPAVVVDNAEVWSRRVGDELARALDAAEHATKRMVRASLVKNTAFMRALGRPTRDQVVSMRPSELTTLEAIDLANGPELADALARGAKPLVARFEHDPAGLVRWLYESTLTRPPTAAELALGVELLGETPSAAAVEDLLWSVLMLPEFQWVR